MEQKSSGVKSTWEQNSHRGKKSRYQISLWDKKIGDKNSQGAKRFGTNWPGAKKPRGQKI